MKLTAHQRRDFEIFLAHRVSLSIEEQKTLLVSEQTAWEEIKRLKEENERLAKRAQLSKEDAEHFASIGFEFSEQIKLLENQLQDALNTLKWYADGDNWIGQCTDVEIDKGWNAQQAIDRIQEGNKDEHMPELL